MFRYDSSLRALSDKIKRRSKTLPEVLGNEAVNHSLDAFRAEAWDGRAWPERAAPNEDPGRNLLVQSGNLRRSIRIITKSGLTVTIGSSLPYARAHNEGLSGRQTVRSHSRRVRGQRVSVRQHTREMNLPQRQFMGKSKSLSIKLSAAAIRHLLR